MMIKEKPRPDYELDKITFVINAVAQITNEAKRENKEKGEITSQLLYHPVA